MVDHVYGSLIIPRLALMELSKSLPWGAVWDELCVRSGVPAGADWLADVAKYEKTVLSKR